MSVLDAQFFILLSVQLLTAVLAAGFYFTIRFLRRRAAKSPASILAPPAILYESELSRPATWLAIRAATPDSVQSAIGLARSAPCSWLDGMAGSHEFFISPRIHGWVIVTGIGIPEPDNNVDTSFHFLISLSRKLGHIQLFQAEKFSRHHAWMRLDDGCVTRAYAWAGETVWNQGAKTVAETELKMKCFPYGQESFSAKTIADNFNKVPLLAARWSLDPARIRLMKKVDGIAGDRVP